MIHVEKRVPKYLSAVHLALAEGTQECRLRGCTQVTFLLSPLKHGSQDEKQDVNAHPIRCCMCTLSMGPSELLVTSTATVIHISRGVRTHKITMPLDKEEFFQEMETKDILN